MKHRSKHLSKQPNYLLIASIAIVVVVGLILLFSGGDKSVEEQQIEQEANQQQPVLEEEFAPDEKAVEVIKEEVPVAASTKVGEEGLCEDYFFEQGDQLEILKHKIQVVKIADGGVRVSVDGENSLLNEGDSEYVAEELKISIAPGKILYFGQDDESNSVQMRVGCDYDDNTNEKYVQNRGERICKEVYEDCQDSFNIEIEE